MKYHIAGDVYLLLVRYSVYPGLAGSPAEVFKAKTPDRCNCTNINNVLSQMHGNNKDLTVGLILRVRESAKTNKYAVFTL